MVTSTRRAPTPALPRKRGRETPAATDCGFRQAGLASFILFVGVLVAPTWALAQADPEAPDWDEVVESGGDEDVEGGEGEDSVVDTTPAPAETPPSSQEEESSVEWPGTAPAAPARPRPVPSEVAEVDRSVAATERSDLLTALGVLTITAAIGGGLAFGIVGERESTLGICQGYAAVEPPRLACVNMGEIEEQRDIALVFATSFAIAAAGAAVAWIVAAIMGDEPPDPEASACSVSPLGVHCQGRF